MTTSIRAQVSPTAIAKVGRMFNGTLQNVLVELFQNARRAAATAIAVTIEDHVITIRDNGSGIDTPSTILTMGSSQWSDELASREDPAGMGFFSLSGREVEVMSGTGDAGWCATIPSDAWDGQVAVPIVAIPAQQGTMIRFTLPEAWRAYAKDAVRMAAFYLPVPVTLEGEAVPQGDYLAGATAVIAVDGVEIGIFHDRREIDRDGIDFHGLIVTAKLPRLREIHGPLWSVRVRVRNAPYLKLVLPTRKEVIDDAGFAHLVAHCRRAQFEHIATRDRHSLGFDHWLEAAALDIPLPEAEARLHPWTPTVADYHSNGRYAELSDVHHDKAVIFDLGNAATDATLARALQLNRSSFVAYDPVSQFKGYPWYDRIPKVEEIAVSAMCDGKAVDLDAERSQRLVDSVRIAFTIGEGETSLPTDIALVDNESYSIEEGVVLIAKGSTLSPDDATQLIIDAFFSSSDDAECDSYDTQLRYATDEAREIALKLLLSEDEAIVDRLQGQADQLFWILGKRGATIHLDGDTRTAKIELAA